MQKTQFSISISPPDKRELKARAAAEGRSLSSYVNRLIADDLATPQEGGTVMLNGRRRRGQKPAAKREALPA